MSQATHSGLPLIGRMIDAGVRTAAWVAFWLAIVLPATYLPLLALGYVDAAAAFILVHVMAVLTGQAHGH
ncbi:MAG: hypothetical protein ABEH64_11260 [Salinirussus sp.]